MSVVAANLRHRAAALAFHRRLVFPLFLLLLQRFFYVILHALTQDRSQFLRQRPNLRRHVGVKRNGRREGAAHSSADSGVDICGGGVRGEEDVVDCGAGGGGGGGGGGEEGYVEDGAG